MLCACTADVAEQVNAWYLCAQDAFMSGLLLLFVCTGCIYVVLFLCAGDDEEHGRRKRSKTHVTAENENGYAVKIMMGALFRESACERE